MNYLEIHIKSPDGRIHFENDDFLTLMNRVASSNNGYSKFQKKVLKQFCEDMMLEMVHDGEDWSKENVYNVVMTSTDVPDVFMKNLDRIQEHVVTFYEKVSKPIHLFPSTEKYLDCVFEDKTVFKVNNLVFINFVKAVYQSEPRTTFNYVYVNYNDHVKCDVMRNIKMLNDVSANVVKLNQKTCL